MAINAYTGFMGSGKSYEVVSTVILDAIAAGRTVVTNVDGIDSDKCREYLSEHRGLDLEKLGQVKHVTNDDVASPTFFPHGEDWRANESTVKGGDLVAIDEAWRFWSGDSKILPQHYEFFRYHRHYVNDETKVTCDLVVMVQDITDLNRKLKNVIELSFRTTKIKSLGMNNTYRVEMWEGAKQTFKGRTKVENKQYSKDIFPLYSSYSGGTGSEVSVDKRQNLLNSKSVWIVGFLTIVGLVMGGWFAMRYFTEPQRKAKEAELASKKVPSSPGKPASAPARAPTMQGPGPSLSAPTAASVLPGASPSASPDRVVGVYKLNGQAYVLLASGATYRPESPSMLQRQGLHSVVITDGGSVARRFDFNSNNSTRSPR